MNSCSNDGLPFHYFYSDLIILFNLQNDRSLIKDTVNKNSRPWLSDLSGKRE